MTGWGVVGHFLALHICEDNNKLLHLPRLYQTAIKVKNVKIVILDCLSASACCRITFCVVTRIFSLLLHNGALRVDILQDWRGLITTFTDFLEFEHFESFFISSFDSPLIGNIDISWKNIHLKLPPTQTSLYWTTLECKQHERELLMFSLMMRQNVPLYLLFTVVILQMKQIKISDQSANPRATCPVN